MSISQTLIIIPTFNESENIASIIEDIFKVTNNVEVLVVDDNSPDGTSDIVANMQGYYSNLHLMTKNKDKGFAKAYVSGFQYAIDKNYEYVIQMDADGSHQPVFLNDMMILSKKFDVVVGSRWVNGGSVKNWSLKRKALSILGSLYSRLLLNIKIKDVTSGFKIIKVEQIKKIDFSKIKSNGYAFQIEILLELINSNSIFYEYPIEFIDRIYGNSKMNFSIILEALHQITKKGLQYRFEK